MIHNSGVQLSPVNKLNLSLEYFRSLAYEILGIHQLLGSNLHQPIV
jgi:hypothetical protein